MDLIYMLLQYSLAHVVFAVIFLFLFLRINLSSKELQYRKIIGRINIAALIIYVLGYLTPYPIPTAIIISYITEIVLLIVCKRLKEKEISKV